VFTIYKNIKYFKGLLLSIIKSLRISILRVLQQEKCNTCLLFLLGVDDIYNDFFKAHAKFGGYTSVFTLLCLYTMFLVSTKISTML
jgi:hypothetical protein